MKRAALALALLAGGCAAPPPPHCEAGLAAATGFTAMFGLTRQGQRIPQPAWDSFEARELTARFPGGYTLTEATGTWRNRQGGTTREPSRFFFVLVPAAQAAEVRAGLDAAREAYRRDFAQESVGLMVQPACVAGLF